MDNESRSSHLPSRRSDSTAIASSFLLVASAGFTGWVFGANSTGLFMIVAVACGLMTAILISIQNRRRQLLERDVDDSQLNSKRWEDRWRALQADSVQAATALAQLTDGVIVLSTEGKVLLVNPAARKLLSLEYDDSNIGWLFIEAVRDPKIKKLIETARNQKVASHETFEVSSGKLVRPLRVDAKPIEFGDEGKMLLIIRDETESRRVDEIRREFVANVSHELKTPLAAIKGYAETVELAIQDDPESACHFMQQILSQCQRLERLVADMMQLARAQGGTHHMTLTRLRLPDVITEAFRSCQPIAESKQISLTIGEIQDDAIVIADREATLTIANNLISNALRYTHEGGNVKIATERIDDSWALVVQDDGVGIPESEQQRIFERFYRVAKTRESTGGGTGIGLSIVKNLALAQSGKVQLSSRPGQGSTFRVLLPADDMDDHLNIDSQNRDSQDSDRQRKKNDGIT